MKAEHKLTSHYADVLGESSDDTLDKVIRELEIAYTAPERPAGLSWTAASQRLALISQQTLDAEIHLRTWPIRLGAKQGSKKALLRVAAIVVLTLLSAALLRTLGASWFRQSQNAQTSPSLSTTDTVLLQQLLQSQGAPASIRQLAQSDQFAEVNRVLDSGNVEIQKVYADANNVVIGYTIDTSIWAKDTSSWCIYSQLQPHQCVTYTDFSLCTPSQIQSGQCGPAPALCPLTIMTSENQTLPCYGSLANLGPEGVRYTNKRVAVLAYYDTSSILGSPQHLLLKVLLTTRGSSSGEELDDVTVPFHAHKTVINVNQTVTSHGDALTLERVVITPTEARFYNSTIPSASISPVILSIAGKTYDPYNFHIDFTLASAYAWDETSARGGNTVSFYDALVGQTGTWILTEAANVMNPYHSDTWTFTFTVS